MSKHPLVMNMGSGMDWREDHFNVDISEYWKPDMVWDFNVPFPEMLDVETKRFGPVAVRHGVFEKIVANDVLEHLTGLAAAMTSCLNLLTMGGEMHITVPYDLSYGAWQDPTHVRAFNERSWWYYTTLFWYMGWTEARFDLADMSLELSPTGRKLHEQGHDLEMLAMTPRAIDKMNVVLRKRALTEQDRKNARKQGYRG